MSNYVTLTVYKGPLLSTQINHDDVIKWKHCPRYLPFVRGIHRSPVNSPHKGQWRTALMFSLNSASTNGRANNQDAGQRPFVHASVRISVRLSHLFTPQPLRAPGVLSYPERAGGRAARQTSPVNTLTSIIFHGSFLNLARTFITLRSRTSSIMEVLPH